MKLSQHTLNKISVLIMGGSELSPYMTLTDLKNLIENKNPSGLSRMNFTLERLAEINGTAQLKRVFELIFSESHFDGSGMKIDHVG